MTHYEKYGRNHYQNNKDQYYRRRDERKRWIRKLIQEAKKSPCTDCGIEYPYYVMDFDHRDGEKKFTNPSNMNRLGWGEQKIIDELAKCDIVCANCHRERTYSRMVGSTPT